MNTYSITLAGGYGFKTVTAGTRSKAKYASYLDYDITGGLGFMAYCKWIESIHLLHKWRVSDLFGDPEQFERMKEARDIPFVQMGSRVILDSSKRGKLYGTVCGATTGHNLAVCFDGTYHIENCHPHYRMAYLDSKGSVIQSFGD